MSAHVTIADKDAMRDVRDKLQAVTFEAANAWHTTGFKNSHASLQELVKVGRKAEAAIKMMEAIELSR